MQSPKILRLPNKVYIELEHSHKEVTTYLSISRLELLQCGQDKDGRLTHAGLGLAQDVHTENSLVRKVFRELKGFLIVLREVML